MWLEIALILLIATAILSLYSKKVVHGVFFLAIMACILGVIFYMFNAPYVAVIQIFVYGGAVTVLMLVVLLIAGEIEIFKGGEGEREEE